MIGNTGVRVHLGNEDLLHWHFARDAWAFDAK